jgi:hypothetical protein
MKKKKLAVGVAAGIAVVLTLILARYIDWKMHQKPADYRPLSAIESIIASMMASSNEIVYLNLCEIGKDDNYLCFEPISNGVEIRFPMYDNRQNKYKARIKQVCSSLSLPINEIPDDKDDRYLKGTNYIFVISGTPGNVYENVIKVITQTFNIKESDKCDFNYVDMHGQKRSANKASEAIGANAPQPQR